MNKAVFSSLTVLSVSWVLYNGIFYCTPAAGTTAMTEKALQGQRLWQRYNCNSCHQLYGLGGYLGPDLTNEMSRRRPDFVKAMINAGSGSMPAFQLSAPDQDALLEFLRAVDATGHYPDYDAKTDRTGWVTIRKK